ncbi:uncharacterized protein LOC127788143 [Diospyros lotus]|uniref:uncharacterized protein LOC127788143 n=1 Tax=Diospyros lotus TaxID=55363 RepID=UPI00225481E3|nr:uncharacterized protein LOC127788143 [Diospyros lotus]
MLQRSRSRQGFETDETPVSVWEAFKKALNDKYFSLSWRQEKSWEFVNQKQTGEMSVAQYDTKFNHLIKYKPMYDTDEWQKAQKFMSGLRVDLLQALSTWSIKSYEEALSKALTTERNLLQVKQIRSGETKGDSEQKSGNKNPQGSKQCFKCKKSHLGRKCLAGTSICYSCGKQGHISRDCRKRKETPFKDLSKVVCFQCNQPGHYSSNCPKRPRLGQADGPTEKAGEARGTCQGRAYNLIKEDVGTNPAVVQGTLFISDTPVHALIDPGSTHSFMSYALATSLELDVYDFDVILGMDFLSRYDASIDCRRKVMTIKKLEGEWVKFRGQGDLRNGKMISARKAEKLISQGSHGCIAYARLKEKEVPKLNEVWIVREYGDVFPEDLPGLPLAQEIEFSVKLVLGTKPISIPPYRRCNTPDFQNKK